MPAQNSSRKSLDSRSGDVSTRSRPTRSLPAHRPIWQLGSSMDRRHLEYFLAVAEAGSFTRAAASSSIAQPSLSHTIGALEREVGPLLFERLGPWGGADAAGEALVEPARRSVRSFVVVANAVKSVAEGGFGRLTVVSNTLWAMEPLVAVMGEFRRLYPGVLFTVTDPTTRSEVLGQCSARRRGLRAGRRDAAGRSAGEPVAGGSAAGRGAGCWLGIRLESSAAVTDRGLAPRD